MIKLNNKNNIPNWDNYFMQIAKVVSKRSNCIRRSTGAIIIKDNRIISTGYNGTPRGIQNCNENGCKRCNSDNIKTGENLEECICSHAEENSIVQAAYHGVSLKNATMYATNSPCIICTKMIINAGIKKVIYLKKYKFNKLVESLFKQVNISFEKLL